MNARLASSSMPAAPSGGRIFGLDLLRAFSLLVVLYLHGFAITQEAWPSIPVINLDAVTLFFVLSGFLIGGILLRQIQSAPNGAGLLRFWIARWMRTLPAYGAALLLIGAAWVGLGGTPLPAEWTRFWWFGQNLAWAHPPFFGEAWSLCVEEWFYLLTPLAAFLAVGAFGWPARQVVPMIAIAVIAGSVITRLATHAAHPDLDPWAWDAAVRKQVVTRMDSLMWGVLAAWLAWVRPALFRRLAWPAGIIGIIALAMIASTPWDRPVRSTWLALTLMPACVALLMPLLSGMRHGPRWLVPGVAFISSISYSIYLLHASFVLHLIVPALAKRWPAQLGGPAARYLLYWTLSIGLGWVLWRTVERPFMRLRDVCLARLDRRQASIRTTRIGVPVEPSQQDLIRAQGLTHVNPPTARRSKAYA